MSYANRGMGCGLDSVGGVIGTVISFLTWLIYGAVASEWRDATRAGAIVAMAGCALFLIGSLMNGMKFAYVVGFGLVVMAFPTAMYNWGTGNTHGYAWLWTILWMAGSGVAIMLLKFWGTSSE